MADKNTPLVAFVGLGSMGLGMARNLLKHGHKVIGVDPSAAARDAFTAAGGTVAANPGEAAVQLRLRQRPGERRREGMHQVRAIAPVEEEPPRRGHAKAMLEIVLTVERYDGRGPKRRAPDRGDHRFLTRFVAAKCGVHHAHRPIEAAPQRRLEDLGCEAFGRRSADEQHGLGVDQGMVGMPCEVFHVQRKADRGGRRQVFDQDGDPRIVRADREEADLRRAAWNGRRASRLSGGCQELDVRVAVAIEDLVIGRTHRWLKHGAGALPACVD